MNLVYLYVCMYVWWSASRRRGGVAWSRRHVAWRRHVASSRGVVRKAARKRLPKLAGPRNLVFVGSPTAACCEQLPYVVGGPLGQIPPGTRPIPIWESGAWLTAPHAKWQLTTEKQDFSKFSKMGSGMSRFLASLGMISKRFEKFSKVFKSFQKFTQV